MKSIFKMEVQISGCVFSSLFLEIANSQGDIDGFLLGEISHRTTRVVSDSQERDVKHECIFAVQEIICCPSPFSFYDGVGRIHSERLTQILGSKKQHTLGWFKLRRNARIGVSMRERAIHKNLLDQLEITDSENFIFSVFTSHQAKNLATHAFQHSANYFEKQSRDEFLDNVGQLQQVRHARSMYKNMLGKLKGLKEAVHSSEVRLTNLSEHVSDLKQQLEKAMQEKRLQDTKSKDEENQISEQDLISFDDADTQEPAGSQEPARCVVIAKRIQTHTVQNLNSVDNSSNIARSRLQHARYLDGLSEQSKYNDNASPQY